MVRIFVGVMTGTSIDGIDLALVKIDGTGLSMQVETISTYSMDMDADLTKRLRQFADQGLAMTAREIVVLQVSIGYIDVEEAIPLGGSDLLHSERFITKPWSCSIMHYILSTIPHHTIP